MTDATTIEPDDIAPVALEDEMRRSYLDYAMSVIVARALPDVRDGLKPVHRRILYAMREGGYGWNQPFRKSARIVGDVMGKFHPHGDSAIYDAMVRMAQPFSMRLPLVAGQGNFGSMDNDPPAAMRYTEARLARAAEALLTDIDKDTVDFQPNYDDSEQEPAVLPAQYPNLLVNGAGGIAVGMATNIPTHNLGEVIDACFAYLDNPAISVDELMDHLPGPDFPTGGVLLGRKGIRQAYHTGRGTVILRARTAIEDRPGNREAIIVTEVPYQVNKARMIERISEVVTLKLVEGIQALRDESDRRGIRIVIELKPGVEHRVLLNQLYRHTQLQVSFGINMLALDGGRPETLGLDRIIRAFTAFREEVVARRTRHDLGKARERAHVLVGLAVAVANIDEIIRVIRQAGDPAEARAGLLARAWPAADTAPLLALLGASGGAALEEEGGYRLSVAQARAILDLRLHRLTALERRKIDEELEEVAERIRGYLEILGSREKLLAVIRAELQSVRDRFADARRSTFTDDEIDPDEEDLIQREDMVVTVSQGGNIRRVQLSTYRAQKRGGKGRAGMSTRYEDAVSQVIIAHTHTPLLFFSASGIVYKLKVHRLPRTGPQGRGVKMQQVIEALPAGERITAVMAMPDDEERWPDLSVMFATGKGNVRRNTLADFINIPRRGKIAMKLDEDDVLVGVKPCGPGDHILLATRQGKALRFPAEDVREFVSRASTGVRGIALRGDDRVISMSVLDGAEFTPEERDTYLSQNGIGDLLRTTEMREREQMILSVASDGYGKRTSAYDYRVTKRGGQGVEMMARGGEEVEVVAAFPVEAADQLLLMTDGGQLIRCPVTDIRIARRTTRGVRLFDIPEGARVVQVSHLADADGEDRGEAAGSGADAGNSAGGQE